MKRGFGAKVIYDRKGRVFGLCTGSDACTEHEIGINKLLHTLCGATESTIAENAKNDENYVIPSLEYAKTIKRNLDKLVFVQRGFGSTAEAIMGYSPYPIDFDSWLFRSISYAQNSDITGAYDDESFAVVIKTEKLIKKMKVFFESMQAGEVMFAGTFMENINSEWLSGVILARKTYFRPEHKEAMNLEDKAFKRKIQLKVRSRAEELKKMSFKFNNKPIPGFIFPMWAAPGSEEIWYSMNSMAPEVADSGNYSFNTLKDWIQSGYSYRLTA